MPEEATPQDVNRFIKAVDGFLENRDKLLAARSRVYASNDPGLIADYETTVGRANNLKRVIETTTGAWRDFKQWWATNVTDTTSMVIGDAIDTVRSWFGYKPAGDLTGLGAVQIPAAAWLAGITGAIYLINKSINEILVKVEAARIQRETGMPRDKAIAAAKQAYSPSIFSVGNLAPYAIGLGIVWYVFFRNQGTKS